MIFREIGGGHLDFAILSWWKANFSESFKNNNCYYKPLIGFIILYCRDCI